jgi:hypothetical protein
MDWMEGVFATSAGHRSDHGSSIGSAAETPAAASRRCLRRRLNLRKNDQAPLQGLCIVLYRLRFRMRPLHYTKLPYKYYTLHVILDTTNEIQASKAAMIGRNMKYLLAVIMLLVCLPMESRATFDGNWLSRTCGGDNELTRYVCQSWILGFQSGIVAAYAESHNMHICLPRPCGRI